MTANLKAACEGILLSGVVGSCWISVIGMLRMRTPMEALHFLSFPSCVAAPLLTIAIFLETGVSAAACKMVFITAALLGFNAIVVHAVARAFRTREVGHWEPLVEDDIPLASKKSTS